MFVVISGASRGIGKDLSYIFAKHKFNLLLNCEKNIDELNKIKCDIEKKYEVKVITKKGDFNEEDLVLVDNIYILINNCSKALYKQIQDIDDKEYFDIINSNLTTTFHNTKTCLKKMLKSKDGIIANISSMWGILGSSFETIYSMTKGGINAFTKALSKELELSNIKCVAFALGMVDTDMNNCFSDIEKEEIVNSLDNKKMFSKEDIAKKIYETLMYNKFNTGDIIIVNNGLK